MGKIVIKKISLVLLATLFLTNSLYSQNPRFRWSTSEWQKGITTSRTFKYGEQNFLFLSNPTNGNAWTFNLKDDGTMGDVLWYTNKWYKGVTTSEVLKVKENNFLFLSAPDLKKGWIFELTKDGKVGKLTWEPKTWREGIEGVASYQAGGKTYLFVVCKNSGSASIYEVTHDGKLGKETWKSDGFDRDIYAVDTYKINGKNYLLFCSAQAGKAHIYELSEDGKLLDNKWSANWEKGIKSLEIFNSGGKNYLFVLNTTNGHTWIFDMPDNVTVGNNIWFVGNYEKGIRTVCSYDLFGMQHFLLSNSVNGHAWIITNFHKHKPDLTDVTPSGKVGEKAKELVKNADMLYSRLYKLEERINRINDKGNIAKGTVKKSSNVSQRTRAASDKINRAYDVLGAFCKIPMVGTPVTALRLSVNPAKSKIDAVAGHLENLNNTVIVPVEQRFEKSSNNMGFASNCVLGAALRLRELKEGLVTYYAEKKKKELSEVVKLASVNQELSNLEKSVSELEAELGKIEGLYDKVGRLNGAISKAENGITKFDNGVNKVDNVSKEVDNVLNKRFEKTVLKKKISISLRDVLSGGKVGKVFQSFVDKWAGKLIEPLTKKMNIKLPAVPNFDEFKNELNNLSSEVTLLGKYDEALRKKSENVIKTSKKIAGFSKEL